LSILPNFKKNYREKVFTILTSLLVIISSFSLFPFEMIKTDELADNPKNCPYYISLQSILANYPLLSFDRANVIFIKQRLIKFEQDIVRNKSPKNLIKPYSNSYQNILSAYGLSSISNTNNSNIILTIANKSVSTIDNYYFDEKLNCPIPLQDWKRTYSRRVLNYNLGGMYYKTFNNPYLRILFSVDSGVHIGVFPGYFVNNQTTTLTTQFLTGMPILTALYVVPTYDFNNIGSYSGLVPWCSFWSGFVTDPFLRKLLNITGIDAFTLSNAEVSKRKKTGEITGIPDATLLPNNAMANFGGNDFSTYINNNSYGVTYLANQINYINPKELHHAKHAIQRYFARPVNHDPVEFKQATAFYYDRLRTLNGKHDVILEAKQSSLNVKPSPYGLTHINGIVGERAFFSADCPESSCLFVYNLSHASGWHALVNGKFKKIMTVNFAFMATEIPQGHSIIWFFYQPFSSLFFYLLSMITLVGIFSKVKTAQA
jgi:hypothetical protein